MKVAGGLNWDVMKKPFEHVVIVGCGLLGASLGLALRKKGLAKVITGVGRRGSPSVAVACKRGAIDRATDDVAAAVRGGALEKDSIAPPPADLVVLCVPVRQFPETFKQFSGALSRGALVTDVGSTKAQVMKWAGEFLPGEAQFVGSHPMTGSEKSGPQAAREDLYQNAVCLVCRPERTTAEAAARVAGMWKELGMRVIECEARQHDRWVAAVSHLPYAVAATLVNSAMGDPGALEAAAGGFVDTSRVASGDVTMWTDILLTNREAAADMMGRFRVQLETLRDAVERGDEAAIRQYLTAAKNARDAFMAHRQAPLSGRAREQGA
jgi:prephenate dehydrogenase